MVCQLMLSEEEVTLLRDLLEQELEQLPSEIHHTDDHVLAEQLEQRQKRVRHLIERLEGVAVR